MTEGNLVKWHKKVGDKLAPGESIAEVETDKAAMDFEFQDDGYLAKILVPDGTNEIPVNKPIAVYVENEDADIRSYCRSGEGLEVAGGFKIQGLGAVLFDAIDGDFYNCVGLPASRVFGEICSLVLE